MPAVRAVSLAKLLLPRSTVDAMRATSLIVVTRTGASSPGRVGRTCAAPVMSESNSRPPLSECEADRYSGYASRLPVMSRTYEGGFSSAGVSAPSSGRTRFRSTGRRRIRRCALSTYGPPFTCITRCCLTRWMEPNPDSENVLPQNCNSPSTSAAHGHTICTGFKTSSAATASLKSLPFDRSWQS